MSVAGAGHARQRDRLDSGSPRPGTRAQAGAAFATQREHRTPQSSVEIPVPSAATIGVRDSGNLERIPFARTTIAPEAIEAACKVLSSGWVTSGPEVQEFERDLATWIGAEFAVAVSSCTAALEISLRALDLPPGAKVLTPTMTFCGAVQAIVHAGLTPVLVDVNPRTLMPDVQTTAAAADRDGPVDAMVVLHFAGYPAPVEELAAAAGLPLGRVIEDAAHALGTKVGDRAVGSISASTCLSFYATKNLPLGEGGMITTNDFALAERAQSIRLHGMSRDAWKRYLPGSSWRYEVAIDGIKANMTDLQAAIGRAQLRHLSAWQQQRQELAQTYDRYLSDIEGIVTPAWPDNGVHAWHLYVIQLAPEFPLGRDEFIVRLAQRGIDCSVHFIPLHHQPYFQSVLGSHITRQFPAADAVFPRIVSLPFFAGMREDQVAYVCEGIAELAR